MESNQLLCCLLGVFALVAGGMQYLHVGSAFFIGQSVLKGLKKNGTLEKYERICSGMDFILGAVMLFAALKYWNNAEVWSGLIFLVAGYVVGLLWINKKYLGRYIPRRKD